MSSILTFEKVGKNISNKNVLANLSFGLQENETISISGKKDSGKSTIFKILMNTFSKDKGKIFVGGMDYDTNKNEILNLLGYLPQENVFDNYLNVYNNLYYFGRLKDLDHKKCQNNILKWSERFNVKNELYKNISDISFYKKRKLSFVRLLLAEPKILLLDNPTIGMNRINQSKIWSIINELKRDKTILFISDNNYEIESYSDRILILNKGNIKLNSSILNLKNHYKGNYKYEFSFDRIVPNKFVKKIKNNEFILDFQVRENKIIFLIREKHILFQVLKLALEYDMININFEKSKLNQIIKSVYENE